MIDADWRPHSLPEAPRTVDAVRGLVVELPDESFVGAVVAIEKNLVTLEDRRGKRRVFPLGEGFLVEGAAVVLRAPRAAAPTAGARTASGSRVDPARSGESQRARVAIASRIYVEGRHDAELVEKIWGSDLREAGVVVEYLEGVDNLPAVLHAERPSRDRRIGVLVDHLVPGSKESRIADGVAGPHVLVVGHPFIDVWQGIKPACIGLDEWPTVPRGTDWKHGVLTALGWPHESQADVAAAWQRILASVRGYTDLEPELLGRVEELIDFVTAVPG